MPAKIRPPAAEQLYAGFATTEITPPHPRGMSLMGMGRIYPGAQGVLDPIMARAAYIGTRSQGALMLVLDTVFPKVLKPHQDEVIAELARVTGLPRARIWITCTHCHSSFGESFDEKWVGGNHVQLRNLSAHMEILLPRLIAVGTEAFRRRQAAEIGYAAAPVSQVGRNRRFKTSAGIVLSAWANGPCPPPGLRPVERGPHDPDVGLVVFRDRRHRPFGALVNYNSHIHLYPTLNFTAELAGAVVAKLERKHRGLTVVYTNGTEGTTCLDTGWLAPQSPRPEEWDRQYLHEREILCRRMLKGIDAAWKKLSFAGRVRLRCGETVVGMRVLDTDGRDNVRLEQPLKALTIDDLALVGEQEEAWAEMSLDIKAASPFPSTFVVGFVGFRNKYFPTSHGIEEGGYESQLLFRDGDGYARTVQGAVKLLGKLRQEARS